MSTSDEVVQPLSDPDELVLGSTTPRRWTPPLRELTRETSFGYDVIDFANDVLHHPLDPWQEWLIIHGCELLPDGRPRFRKLLVLVARQNGKTELLVVLTLYWLFKTAVPLILGTSTKTNYAKEAWHKAIALADAAPELADLKELKWWYSAAGGEECFTRLNSRYKIAAANDRTGRSLTVHRLILDELRTHNHYGCWDAAVPAGNAVSDFQCWALSNAGTDDSVVLNDLHDSALLDIENDVGGRLGLFEWSCEEDADPLDVHALAQANPNLNRRIDQDVLLEDARTAVEKGGDVLTGFKTENMCIHVPKMDPAVDAAAWRRCHVPGDMSDLKNRIALCLDVAPDGMHATLVAAARVDDEKVRVEVVESWEGYRCTDKLRRQLPRWIGKVKPRVIGWFPSGPAAALAADMRKKNEWPQGVKVNEIQRDTAAACMGLSEQVTAKRIEHGDDPLLNAHVTGAEKLKRGDVWIFSRKGEGHCDAAYATAGAVHLARTLPSPVGKPRIITAA